MKRLIRKIAVAVLVVIGAFAALPAKATPHFINELSVGNGFVVIITGQNNTQCCIFVFNNASVAQVQALVSAHKNRDPVRLIGTNGEIGDSYGSQALVAIDLIRDQAAIPPHSSQITVPYRVFMFGGDVYWWATNISGAQAFQTFPPTSANVGAVAAVLNAFSGKYGVSAGTDGFDINDCSTYPGGIGC